MNAITEQTAMYRQAGFTLARTDRHQIWRCPCGHAQLVDKTTRGGGSGSGNSKARLNRTLKECKRRLREHA